MMNWLVSSTYLVNTPHSQARTHEDIFALVGEVIQPGVHVYEACRVDQGPRVTSQLEVVPLTLEVPTHLLHISNPVDLGVCHTTTINR